MQRSYTMTELFNTCIDAWGLSLSSKIVSMQLDGLSNHAFLVGSASAVIYGY